MDFLQYTNSSMVAAFVVFVIFIFHFIKKAKTKQEKIKKTAPEPPGSWPLIGHLPLLSGNELLHVKLESMAYKYGPIFTLRIGSLPFLVVSNSELARELFTTKDSYVSSRAQLVAGKILAAGSFGFSPYGAYWRDMRKFAVTQLLSTSRLELLKHVRISEVQYSIKEMYNIWKERNTETEHVTVELKQWFEDLKLNVMLRMIAGKKYNGGNEREARRWQKAMREFFLYLGTGVLRDAVPFLGWLDVGGYEKAMKRTAKELDSIVGEWIEEHRRRRREVGEINGAETDFMDVLLSAFDGKCLEGYDGDTIIKATSLSMIAGGTDTTIATSTWVISVLLNNPHALKKAQEELDLHVGKDRAVNDTHLNKLVYLQAVIKEAFRLYPPSPFIAPRQFINDCTVGGYDIPKGTLLIVNAYKIHRDPLIWEDPLEFKPERFLNKTIDVKGLDYEFLPFGSGRRSCPGISFGMQMVTFTLATFLHAFQISRPTDSLIDMTQGAGLTNTRATPLQVLVSPRLHPTLYA